MQNVHWAFSFELNHSKLWIFKNSVYGLCKTSKVLVFSFNNIHESLQTESGCNFLFPQSNRGYVLPYCSYCMVQNPSSLSKSKIENSDHCVLTTKSSGYIPSTQSLASKGIFFLIIRLLQTTTPLQNCDIFVHSHKQWVKE